MTITNLYAAESWNKIYRAFEQVSFVSYDYDTVKQSLIDYLKLYYKESFNDFIESSELIAYVELFAYISEQLAYRVDIASHENFISTAARKQSILRLAKLVSYTASRNIPARGLVKIQSISTSESLFDSQGNDLAGIPIVWADPNNSQWKEQFYLIINRVMNGKFGQPQKIAQVGDIEFQLYAFNNVAAALSKGVFPYVVSAASQSMPMEIVASDLDENGPLERSPDPNSTMTMVYADDGLGDSSDLTGFMLFTKQGSLIRTETVLTAQVPNQNILINVNNLNQTDVWVHQVDDFGKIISSWEKAETVNGQNLYFSSNNNRNKFEIETLENDKLRILFGDGNFSNIPSGRFVVWTRQSENTNSAIPKNSVNNEQMSLSYVSNLGINETINIRFSLTSSLQNASASEDIEHIRHTAPTTYYSQGRMVNAQDYNTFLLRDPSILRLKTVNRTFAGQPKYIEWNDASGQYENIKLFGDDLLIKYSYNENTVNSSSSARRIIDDVIEPILVTSGMKNIMLQIIASHLPGVTTSPRHKFIENVKIIPNPNNLTVRLQEKTRIQGLLDRHWYGEPTKYVAINNINHAYVLEDTDGKIWQSDIPTTVDGLTEFEKLSGLQSISDLPSFGLHFNPYFSAIGNGEFVITGISSKVTETFTIEVTADTTRLSVIGSVSGKQPDAIVGAAYTGLISFFIAKGPIDFIPGDSFIVDAIFNSTNSARSTVTERKFLINGVISRINLSGEWTPIPGNLLDTTSGVFDPNTPSNFVRDSSWLIRLDRITDSLGNILTYTVTYRDLKLIATSPTTKFWYNSAANIIDNDSKLVVKDKILVLKSNLNAAGTKALGTNDSYDVVGDVRDSFGAVDLNSLEITPSALGTQNQSIPSNPLQFEKFAQGHYVYAEHYGSPQSVTIISPDSVPVSFALGASTAYHPASTPEVPIFYSRTLTRGTCPEQLDFMWQHFSPYGNLIDPSPSNIHDAFILTAGYYSELRDYLEGRSNLIPDAPTPLQLRNSYGPLLRSKMLSDTVILHPAKIKLLFGSLAQPELRAKFRIVRNPSGTLTNDQIRAEALSVINTYFSIENWDFGVTFYATELISLIHQRLPLDVASVVIVPIFSNNSFGSLFTIEAGTDEILQTAAQLQDIEMVDYLSVSVLRQGSL